VKFRSIQLWTVIVVLVFAPFFFGSVDLFWIVTWTILLSVASLLGTLTPLNEMQSRIMLLFLVLCGVYTLVAVLQVTPNLVAPDNDWSWGRANELLGFNAQPRISSRAELPPLAVGHFLLFATAIISGFTVGAAPISGDKIRWFAQYSILFYAVYGLLALIFTPDMILWAPKLAYRGSLTATFINHNTAATLIGVGVIMWFCSAFSSLQSVGFSSLRVLLLTRSNEEVALRVVVRSAAAFTCFFSLLLTGSRGGLICTCIGLFVAIMLMVMNRRRWSWWVFAGGGAVLLTAAALLSQIGRIGSQGLFDDGRWITYQVCLDAILQRPLLGWGIGTFADVFPSFHPDNLHSWGVWDYAHSTILEIAVEMGLPVAALVAIAAIASVLLLATAAIRDRDRNRRPLAAVTGIAVLGYLHSLIDFSLQIPGFMIVFGILLGAGLAKAATVPTKVAAFLDAGSPQPSNGGG
jgi:O-antigen ligase